MKRPDRSTLCGLAALVPATAMLRWMSTADRAQLLAAAGPHHSITGALAAGFAGTWLAVFAVLYGLARVIGRARRGRTRAPRARGAARSYDGGGYPGGEW